MYIHVPVHVHVHVHTRMQVVSKESVHMYICTRIITRGHCVCAHMIDNYKELGSRNNNMHCTDIHVKDMTYRNFDLVNVD